LQLTSFSSHLYAFFGFLLFYELAYWIGGYSSVILEMLYKVTVCQYRETFDLVSGVPWNLVGNMEFFLALGKEEED
jgi:hypothetical protein